MSDDFRRSVAGPDRDGPPDIAHNAHPLQPVGVAAVRNAPGGNAPGGNASIGDTPHDPAAEATGAEATGAEATGRQHPPTTAGTAEAGAAADNEADSFTIFDQALSVGSAGSAGRENVSPPTPSPPDNLAPEPATAGRSTQFLVPVVGELHGDHAAREVPEVEGTAATASSEARSTALLEQLLESLTQDSAPVDNKTNRRRGGSLAAYWATLQRRWLPMLLVFTGLVMLATWFWVLRPSKATFVATGTILLPKNVGATANTIPVLGEPQPVGDNSSDINTEMAIITSRELVRNALSALPRDLRARGWDNPEVPEQDVQVTTLPVADTKNLINVSVLAYDGESAVKLENKLAEAYIKRTEKAAHLAREQDVQFVGGKVKELHRDLQVAEKDLQNFRQRTGIFDMSAQMSANATHIQQLQSMAEAAEVAAKAGVTDPNLTSHEAIVRGDPLASTLQGKAFETRARYEEALREYIPGASEIRVAAKEWHAAQREADQRIAVVVAAAQRRAQAEQSALTQRAASAQAALNTARNAAARLPTAELQFTQLSGRVAQLQSTSKKLNDYYTTLRLSSNAHIDLPTVLNYAEVTNITATKKKMVLSLSAVAALILSVLTAFLLDRFDKKVHQVADLEPLMHAAVLGSIPDLSRVKERRLARLAEARFVKSELLEPLYVLSSNVVAASTDLAVRSILITSAAQGDGKSLTAVNLATALAYGGYRVILADCNLWRPTQHEINESPLTPGFADVVGKTAAIDATLLATHVPNMSLMTAGSQPLDPFALLATEASRQLLQDLKRRCDFLIIDGPPILSMTDAKILGPLADASALVVAESSPDTYAQRVQVLLRLTGGRLLGVILNRAKQYELPAAYTAYRAHSYAQGDNYGEYERQLARNQANHAGSLANRH